MAAPEEEESSPHETGPAHSPASRTRWAELWAIQAPPPSPRPCLGRQGLLVPLNSDAGSSGCCSLVDSSAAGLSLCTDGARCLVGVVVFRAVCGPTSLCAHAQPYRLGTGAPSKGLVRAARQCHRGARVSQEVCASLVEQETEGNPARTHEARRQPPQAFRTGTRGRGHGYVVRACGSGYARVRVVCLCGDTP